MKGSMFLSKRIKEKRIEAGLTQEALGKELNVSMIPVKEITNFPNHPYQVREDEEMLNMAESIKKFGIIHPVIVRKKENGGYCEDPQNFSGKNYSVSRELGATTNGKTIQNSNRNIRKLNNKCK